MNKQIFHLLLLLCLLFPFGASVQPPFSQAVFFGDSLIRLERGPTHITEFDFFGFMHDLLLSGAFANTADACLDLDEFPLHFHFAVTFLPTCSGIKDTLRPRCLGFSGRNSRPASSQGEVQGMIAFLSRNLRLCIMLGV